MNDMRPSQKVRDFQNSRMNLRPNIMLFQIILSSLILGVKGHGRLLEPPSRASMWRFKDTDPMLIPYRNIIEANYNDNQQFCGGKYTQHGVNGGKCGVCGDRYNAEVKDHEAGGKYAKGIITRNYTKGTTIDVTVEITAAHKGYFEFRLCPWNNVTVPVSHECLDRHLLAFDNGDTKWYLPTRGTGKHNLKIKLPDDVTCDQCLLQWRYRTGNSWGTEDGISGAGFGPQEEFYGCSDVAISTRGTYSQTTASTTAITSSTTETISTSSTTVQHSTEAYVSSTTQKLATTSPTDRSPTEWPKQSGNDLDCGTHMLGEIHFHNCTTFQICIFTCFPAFKIQCPQGTVLDPRYKICNQPQYVPYPCGTAP